MFHYILRRVLATVPVVIVVALVIFSLLYFAPGDPAFIIAGDRAGPAEIERVRQQLGLDQPYLVRFSGWFLDVMQGDLGRSVFSGTPVTELIAQRIGPTVSLVVVTIMMSVTVGIPLGVLAAWKSETWVDRSIMAFAVMGFSTPVFVVGYVLAYLFARELQWLPVQGYRPLSEGLWPWLSHLILPAITVATVYIAIIARITRSTMIEILSQDYIRTARSKGLTSRTILFVHALKNASIPIVTVVGVGIAMLVGGAVVTESVFAIPGLGRLTLDAILQRDYPIIQGVVLMFSLVYVLINLLVDLSYSLLDPRIRY